MTFISYAQNFEDVILNRVFNDIERGFYIDVGANDPVVDSVTKSFYDRGWSGINIEPLSEFFNKLKAGRPRDINLNNLCGSSNRSIEFYEFEGTGLSTINNLIAVKHQLNGLTCEKKIVECKTLDSILEVHKVDCVHFLKIDVEGGEKDVLEGINLNKNKPWVILVEATEPLLRTESKVHWEHLIIDAGYKFTYFDGLNNFYISKQHLELEKYFSSPPNVFDDFTLSGTANNTFSAFLGSRCETFESQFSDLKTNLDTSLNNAHHWFLRHNAIETINSNLTQQLIEANNQNAYWQGQVEAIKLDIKTRTSNLTQQLIEASNQNAYLKGQAETIKHELETITINLTQQLIEANNQNAYLKGQAETIKLELDTRTINLTQQLMNTYNKYNELSIRYESANYFKRRFRTLINYFFN